MTFRFSMKALEQILERFLAKINHQKWLANKGQRDRRKPFDYLETAIYFSILIRSVIKGKTMMNIQ